MESMGAETSRPVTWKPARARWMAMRPVPQASSSTRAPARAASVAYISRSSVYERYSRS